MTLSNSKPPGFLQIGAWVVYGISTVLFLASAAATQESTWSDWMSLSWVGMAWVILSAEVVHYANAQSYSRQVISKPFFFGSIGALLLGAVSQTTFVTCLSFVNAFGPRLLGVSFGWLLIWILIVFGGRELMASVFGRFTRVQIALATATLTVFSLINLTQIAFIRGWWTYRYNESAVQTFWPLWILWWVGAFGIAFAMKEPAHLKPGHRWKPVMVFLLLHVAALLTRISQG